MQMEKKSKQEDNYIEIRGAKVNNLANINVKIPREKFIIIAGVSGSGKSIHFMQRDNADMLKVYRHTLVSF